MIILSSEKENLIKELRKIREKIKEDVNNLKKLRKEIKLVIKRLEKKEKINNQLNDKINQIEILILAHFSKLYFNLLDRSSQNLKHLIEDLENLQKKEG